MKEDKDLDFEKLLAKSDLDYTIRKHGEEVADSTLDKMDRDVVEDRLRNFNFTEDEIEYLLDVTYKLALCHDVGKASTPWQRGVRDGGSVPPHSAKSGFYLWKLLNSNSGYYYLDAAGVVCGTSHHTSMSNINMDFNGDYVENSKFTPNLYEWEVKDMLNNLDECSSFDSFGVGEEDVDRFKTMISYMKEVFSYDNFGEDYKKCGIAIDFMYTYLRKSDSEVSGRRNGNNVSGLQTLSSGDINFFDTLRPIQNKVEKGTSSTDDFVTLEGACGSGKTGASILWAEDKLKNNRADRVIFAMPTRTTVNKMFSRLSGRSENSKEIINEDKITLHHSTGENYLDDSCETADYRRNFNKACTITTVDNLLLSLVNTSAGGSKGKGNIYTSAVIFDEIHSYDDELISKILKTIEILREIGVPVFVMTATLPPQMEKTAPIMESKHIKGEGKNTSGVKRKPCNLSLKRGYLSSDRILKIRENHPESKRIMIPVNTVWKAKKITRSLMEEDKDVICYTGRMPPVQRKKKEEKIEKYFNEPCKSPNKEMYLVTTQVCEQSVDISSDLMITEIAPVDVLNQRSGRIHREGISPQAKSCNCDKCKNKSEHEYSVYVFSNMDDSDNVYPYAEKHEDIAAWQLLKQTERQVKENQIYSFETSKYMVKEAYKRVNLDIWDSTFHEDIINDLVYGEKKQHGEDELNIRNIENEPANMLAYVYKLKDGKKNVKELWREYHDQKVKSCSGGKDCGVHKEENNYCTKVFREFLNDYSIRYPQQKAEEIDETPLIINGKEVIIGDEPQIIRKTSYNHKFGIESNLY